MGCWKEDPRGKTLSSPQHTQGLFGQLASRLRMLTVDAWLRRRSGFISVGTPQHHFPHGVLRVMSGVCPVSSL